MPANSISRPVLELKISDLERQRAMNNNELSDGNRHHLLFLKLCLKFAGRDGVMIVIQPVSAVGEIDENTLEFKPEVHQARIREVTPEAAASMMASQRKNNILVREATPDETAQYRRHGEALRQHAARAQFLLLQQAQQSQLQAMGMLGTAPLGDVPQMGDVAVDVPTEPGDPPQLELVGPAPTAPVATVPAPPEIPPAPSHEETAAGLQPEVPITPPILSDLADARQANLLETAGWTVQSLAEAQVDEVAAIKGISMARAADLLVVAAELWAKHVDAIADASGDSTIESGSDDGSGEAPGQETPTD